MLSALCFLLLSSDPDARQLGRYGPDGQVCSSRVWPRSSSGAAVAYSAGFAGDDIFAVFPSVFVGRTGTLGIMVVMDQKDCIAFFWAVACARLVLLVFYTSRCVPPVVVRPLMLRIMAGLNQRDSNVAKFWRTFLLCTTTGAHVQTAQTVESPQLQSIQVVDISFAVKRQSLMVQP